MEINKADKIISLPDYREQKGLNKILEIGAQPNPLASEDIALIKPGTSTENIFSSENLSNSNALNKAKAKLIDYFKKEFIKSNEFKNTFGEQKWSEISTKVINSVELVRNRQWEKNNYENRAYAFTGSIYGLYSEIVIDRKNGRLKKAFIQID
jgi:hypothetical protein